MNKSKENHAFVTTCRFAETSYAILNKFPNRNYELYQVTVLVINCLLIFSTISLNGISIITIRKSSQLRNKICYFVILLQSIVDLGVGVLSTPLFIYYLLFPVLKTVNCNFMFVAFRLSSLPCWLSIVTLSALTIERYIGVLHPYQYHSKVTKKRILMYICGSSVAIILVVAFSSLNRQIMSAVGSGSILIFFFLTGFVYARIYLVIRRLISSERKPSCESDGRRDRRRILRESRHARSCCLVVVCFAIFLLPFTFLNIFFTVGSFDYMLHMNWSLTSMILNSSVNSLILFWTKTLLRKEAFETLKSLCS